MNQKGPSKKKKGRSKKAQVLSAAVQKATENFIEKGEEIANENPEIRTEMLSAVEDVKKTGKTPISHVNFTDFTWKDINVNTISLE